MVDVPIYTKAEMDAQLDRISALTAELETVKGERDEARSDRSNLLARIHRDGGHFEAHHGASTALNEADKIVAELFVRAEAAEAKLAGGEAWRVNVNESDGRTYLWITRSDGVSAALSCATRNDSGETIASQVVKEYVAALTHPAPTHNDGSGEAVAWHIRWQFVSSAAGSTVLWGHGASPEAAAAEVARLKAMDNVELVCCTPLYTRPDHTNGEVTETMVEAYMKAADNSISEGILRGEPTPRAEYVRAGLEAALRGDAS